MVAVQQPNSAGYMGCATTPQATSFWRAAGLFAEFPLKPTSPQSLAVLWVATQTALGMRPCSGWRAVYVSRKGPFLWQIQAMLESGSFRSIQLHKPFPAPTCSLVHIQD